MLRLLLFFIILEFIYLSILLVKDVLNHIKNYILIFLTIVRTYSIVTNKSAELNMVDILEYWCCRQTWRIWDCNLEFDIEKVCKMLKYVKIYIVLTIITATFMPVSFKIEEKLAFGFIISSINNDL